jgi:hypothetical protein
MFRRSTEYFSLMQFMPKKNSAFVSYISPSSLPYVSGIDLLDETITVYNPLGKSIDMTGYSLCDYHRNHMFKFPSGFVLDKCEHVTVFCCPGKKKHVEQPGEIHLLWTNNDGSYRRKEVLNNGIYNGAHNGFALGINCNLMLSVP